MKENKYHPREVNDAEPTDLLLQVNKPSATNNVSPTVYISTLVACMGSFQYGWVLTQLNVAIYNTDCRTNDNETCVFYPGHSSLAYVLATTAWIVGAGFGSLISSYPSDFFGRKRTLAGNALVMMLGALIQTIAPTIELFTFGRFISGIASGIVSTIAPYYTSEIAPPHIRGILSLFLRFPLGLGMVAQNATVFAWGTEDDWRLIMGFPIFIGAFQLFLSYFMVESPRWLVLNGQLVKARRAVEQLFPEDDADTFIKDVIDESVNISSITEDGTTVEEISTSVNSPIVLDTSSEHLKPDLSILLSPQYRSRLFITVALQVFQHLTGGTVVFIYGSMFFQHAGMTDTRLVNLVTATMTVLSTVFSLFIIDRFPRRSLLIFSIAAMLVMNIAITIGLVFSFLHFSIVATCAYILAFKIGLSPMAWVVPGEIFPGFLRAYANSISRIFYWISYLIMGLGFVYVKRGFGNYCFLPFFWITILAMAFAWFLLPETKNKTLEEIEGELRGRSHERTA